jgi:ADA HAT complex component 1
MAARGRRKASIDNDMTDKQLKRKRDIIAQQQNGHARSPNKRVKSSASSSSSRQDIGSLVEEQLRQEESRSMEDSERSSMERIPSQTTNGTLESPETARLTHVQQRIEQQFSLEILLKHQELRLIEQELAKCQIALEQIRRCELIPYPASVSTAVANESVRTGTGLTTIDTESPAPWGVVDGPYARHYAKWLLPDRKFDRIPADDMDVPRLGLDSPVMAGKTRPHRGNAGLKLQGLYNGYPRNQAGPLLVRRSTDNALVKLVCLDCDRSDFSSPQGFINHCRIAHHRGFESHDAAAIACGQEVDGDEAHAPEGIEVSSLVHPYIRKDFSLEQDKDMMIDLKPKRESARSAKPLAPFAGLVKSDAAPFLSSFLQQKRIGLDLQGMVADASEKTVLSDSSDEDEDGSENDHDSQVDDYYGGRMPARAGMSPSPFGRPSSKGSESVRHDHHTPVPIHASSHDRDLDMMDQELSPNITESTTESNNAPSLVSDDEEDEDDEYEGHSDSVSAASTVEEEDDVVDIEVDDDDSLSTAGHTDSPPTTRRSASAKVDLQPSPSTPKRSALRSKPNVNVATPPQPRTRRKGAEVETKEKTTRAIASHTRAATAKAAETTDTETSPRMRTRREDRHVTFESAAPAQSTGPKSKTGPKKKGGRRK